MTDTEGIAGIALADQEAAAQAETDRLMKWASEMSGVRGTDTYGPVSTAIVRLGECLKTRLTDDCEHLLWSERSPGAFQAFWVPWEPLKLICRECLAMVNERVKASPENDKCDHCQEHVAEIHAGFLQVPAAGIRILAPGYGLGPLIVIFALCADCTRLEADGVAAGGSGSSPPAPGMSGS